MLCQLMVSLHSRGYFRPYRSAPPADSCLVGVMFKMCVIESLLVLPRALRDWPADADHILVALVAFECSVLVSDECNNHDIEYVLLKHAGLTSVNRFMEWYLSGFPFFKQTMFGVFSCVLGDDFAMTHAVERVALERWWEHVTEVDAVCDVPDVVCDLTAPSFPRDAWVNDMVDRVTMYLHDGEMLVSFLEPLSLLYERVMFHILLCGNASVALSVKELFRFVPAMTVEDLLDPRKNVYMLSAAPQSESLTKGQQQLLRRFRKKLRSARKCRGTV